MKTNNNPTPTTRSMSRADFIELNEKVKACNTYQHGYFVIIKKTKRNGTKTETIDTMIMSELKTERECYNDKMRYEALIRFYNRKTNVITCISVQNIFEKYDLWLAGKGAPNARAQQWADIKAAAQA